MTIQFVGDTFESTNRIQTDCYSLDWSLADSLGNAGIPLKSTFEVYGNKNSGKTTFCLSLMGMIGKKSQKNITILDWEGQSKETIDGILSHQGFGGQVNYLLNKGSETSEETLERFCNDLLDDEWNVAMMDSIEGFRPTALMEGQIGDSNMGVFARELGQFVNKLTHITLRSETPGITFLTNHFHPTIGSMIQGQDTPGGVRKKALCHVRINLKRAFFQTLTQEKQKKGGRTCDFGESWLLNGKIDSNRFGFSQRSFYVFLVGGEGIHVGLTAMWECLRNEFAELSAASFAEGTKVSMDGIQFGKLGQIIKNRNEDSEMFVPFINRMRSESLETVVEEEIEEDEPKKGKRK
jgi:RecA/RadA recombinase